MKYPLLVLALCLALFGASGCGSDDATSSETQTSGPEAAADREEKEKPDAPLETAPSKVVIGDYEAEGPFAAVSGQKGDKKPSFDPSGQPAPEQVVTRELEVGSGPAAERGDEVSVYFAGAIFETGKVDLYGWPPSSPSVLELGSSVYGKDWEKSIEGMKVGGIRQVILPSSEFAAGKPVDYVIVLTDLQSPAGKS